MALRNLRVIGPDGDKTLAEWDTDTASSEQLRQIEIEFDKKMQQGFFAADITGGRNVLIKKFDPNAHPRGVYAGKELVGFLMYDVWDEKDGTREASIYRFMIDRKHQRKGYGRAALTLALTEIKAVRGIRKISIGYMRNNLVAKPFYASFGFVEVGTDEDGEMIAELTL